MVQKLTRVPPPPTTAVMRRLVLASLVSMVVLAPGCKKKASSPATATCDQVATHVVTVAHDELAALPLEPSNRSTINTELGPLHDVVARACTDHAWPQPVRTCMAQATTGPRIEQCAGVLPAAARAPMSAR